MFSLSTRNRYPAVFVLSLAILIYGIHIAVPPSKQADAYLPAVAAAAGLVYFLYTKHLSESKLFIDLFKQFNERYDSLNEDLNRIASDSATQLLPTKDRQVLVDYFNLCAEENLYYRAGYIDESVWNSWKNGMKYFASVDRIKELWLDELRQNSYYGFNLKHILSY